MRKNFFNNIHLFCLGAWAICEPWFTDSRDFCELRKYVNHKSKLNEKSCELGSLKFGSQVKLNLCMVHIPEKKNRQ